MASLAASVLASMVIENMLKDDGGLEASKMMIGEGKRKKGTIIIKQYKKKNSNKKKLKKKRQSKQKLKKK